MTSYPNTLTHAHHAIIHTHKHHHRMAIAISGHRTHSNLERTAERNQAKCWHIGIKQKSNELITHLLLAMIYLKLTKYNNTNVPRCKPQIYATLMASRTTIPTLR
jgi:hypothetical protein